MSSDEPYADPEDVAFGKQAAEKAERLEDRGGDETAAEELERAEEPDQPPRPGGKADPLDRSGRD